MASISRSVVRTCRDGVHPESVRTAMLFRVVPTAGFLLALVSATPALAFSPLDRGPLADFLSIFRQSAVPRQTVVWRSGYAPGTVVISTNQRRLYYVLGHGQAIQYGVGVGRQGFSWTGTKRSEEHTSELQSRQYLVCRLLLEKKKKT